MNHEHENPQNEELEGRYAKVLLKTLQESIDEHKQTFGDIPK